MNDLIYAKIIADSVTAGGDRLTTMEVQMHRFVLAEFNTHRVFSRNSASSRAIPIEKQIAKVAQNPACPIEWGSNKSGMQAGDPLLDEDARKAQEIWISASKDAMRHCRELQEIGVHKQIANRVLEPFMWHTVIVSSTDWDNFFEQRCSPLAQPEIRKVAEKMCSVYKNSVPLLIMPGEFHLPYIQEEELYLDLSIKIKASIARCARVSYLTHDNEHSIEKDIILFDRLANANPPHWSPMEHVATPLAAGLNASGNLSGYAQIRHNLHLVYNAD